MAYYIDNTDGELKGLEHAEVVFKNKVPIVKEAKRSESLILVKEISDIKYGKILKENEAKFSNKVEKE